MNNGKGAIRYDTSRLSAIPNMASAISSKIAVFNKQHKDLLTAASQFFSLYPELKAELNEAQQLKRVAENKLNIILNYRQEHGHLPNVKGYASTERLIAQLENDVHKQKRHADDIQQQIQVLQSGQHQMLENLSDNMLDLLDNERIFSQFLGTMILSAPSAEEKNRCQVNEKRKPIYIAALTILLFDDLRRQQAFKTPYIAENLQQLFADDNQALKQVALADLPDDVKMSYREELLKPLAKVALIQSIGSYSPEVDAIFAGNRYQLLSNKVRYDMLALANEKTIDYLRIGLGIPHRVFNSHEEKQAHVDYETTKLNFMLQALESKRDKTGELFDLFKIPVVYASFMMSTKPRFQFEDIYEAYHVIEHCAYKNEYNQEFAEQLLRIVGKFPIGSGVYFFVGRNRQIEKAIVSSLYPQDPFEPICKQVTKNQIQSIAHVEIIVAREDNIYYEDVRYASEYEPEYYEHRYRGQFVWNANELWEVQIPAKVFWRKDQISPPERSNLIN